MPVRSVTLATTCAVLLNCCFLQQLNQLKPPVPHITNVEIQAVSLDGATIVTTIAIANPNSFAVSLIESQAEVSLGSAKLLEVTLPYKVDIKPHGHAEITLPLQVSDKAVLQTAQGDQDEAVHMVDAELRFKTPLGDNSVRLTWQEKLPLPRAPVVKFGGVDVAQQTPGQARLTVRLAIDNPNAFPLSCGAVDGQLLDEDRSLVTVQQKDGPAIAPSKRTEVLVPVDVPFLSIANLLQSRTASVRLTATIVLGGHTFSIDETAPLH